jgi:hypothetical protein
MDTLLLTDKSITPNDEIIASLIGENYIYWEKLMSGIHDQFKDISLEWKNYKDSKCWLMPVVRKKKSLCWISLANNTTKVSFWFGKSIEPLVEKSDLSESLKEQFRVAKVNKMGRGFSILLSNEKDLEDVFSIIEFKSKIK